MSLMNTSPLEIGREAWPVALMKSSPDKWVRFGRPCRK